jgi:hypothetical protein
MIAGYVAQKPPGVELIITHIFWDTLTSHGDKPSCIEETTTDLCFGDPLYKRLQKLVGNDKMGMGGIKKRMLPTEREQETITG